MPNVAEVLREHVTLTVDCVDRLYLNAYVPRLQNEGGVVAFLLQRGQKIPSPALFADITAAFKSKLHQLCETHAIPWIEFRKGERKDDVVQPYRAAFTADEGVVLVGVAQERARAWAATKQMHERLVHFTFHWNSVYVNHYYVYLIDPEWGPSLHVEYKRCHIKQYFKEGRALRTETTFNDTYDFGIGRGLSNFAYLRTLGQCINARLLQLERVAHDCGLSRARLTPLTTPGRTPAGQPAPALKL